MEALGAGWGEEPFPELYQNANEMAARLRARSRAIGDAAWGLDSALRAVRQAGTPEEKEKALARLARAYGETLPPLRNDHLLE